MILLGIRSNLWSAENEIAIMKLIEHPNCVKLFEVHNPMPF